MGGVWKEGERLSCLTFLFYNCSLFTVCCLTLTQVSVPEVSLPLVFVPYFKTVRVTVCTSSCTRSWMCPLGSIGSVTGRDEQMCRVVIPQQQLDPLYSAAASCNSGLFRFVCHLTRSSPLIESLLRLSRCLSLPLRRLLSPPLSLSVLIIPDATEMN